MSLSNWHLWKANDHGDHYRHRPWDFQVNGYYQGLFSKPSWPIDSSASNRLNTLQRRWNIELSFSETLSFDSILNKRIALAIQSLQNQLLLTNVENLSKAYGFDTTLSCNPDHTSWDKCIETDILRYMESTTIRQQAVLSSCFFHEYGRRVGMVPRSSLKERKNSQMVEKRTKTTQQQTKQAKQSPPAESPPSCSLSSVLRWNRWNEDYSLSMGLNSRTKSMAARVYALAKLPKVFKWTLLPNYQWPAATAQCGKNLVTMQVRSIAMLLRRLYPCQKDQWLLCFMPWKKPFLWHNPFNWLHSQVQWHTSWWYRRWRS